MTTLKRLRMLAAIIGTSAACVAIGTAVFGDLKTTTSPAKPVATAAAPKLIDELAKTKYSNTPALAYTAKSGETTFAWQLQPQLTSEARPKDILVMVDTSASQAGESLNKAAQILTALGHELGANDRLDVWTVNLDHQQHTRSLTGGFKSANDKAVKKAAETLVFDEYAAGAVDLKAGIDNALKSFENKAGRQQVILYLGDGESAAGTPLSEGIRVDLGKKMVEKNVQFFSVPLGITIAANTLHGFGMLTGGTVVRVKEDIDTPAGRFEFTKRLGDSLNVPVIKPEKVAFTPANAEFLPGQLPPLRADRAMLVVGTVKGEAKQLAVTIDGTVAGKATTIKLNEAMPAHNADNYFLAAMHQQWNGAASKDAPVVLPADRALAMASEQFRLYRDEFVELALNAIASDRLDHAEKLFAAATNIDPDLTEAKSGLKVVAKLRTGEMTKDQLKKKVADDEVAGQKIAALQLPQEPKPAPGGAAPKPAAPAPAGGGEALVAQAQAAQRQADAEATAIVDETLKRVSKARETDPDGAYEDLKSQRETILSLDKLSDGVRKRLVANLETAMSDVSRKSGETKRRLAAERERISRSRAILNEYEQQLSQDEQTKARLDRFRSLMHQARFELAYREAQVMEQERINRGLVVPPEVYATYRIGQSATQLREQKEMKRLREDRYLLTMMQVDKSFVPYPDEPPVHFPPASVWRELRSRREKYEFKNQTIGADAPKALRNYQSIVEGTHELPGVPKRVKFDTSLKGTTLNLLLQTLEAQFQKNIKFVVREELFRATGDPTLENIREKQFQMDANFSGMTLGSFLDVALGEFKASYIVRPEYIEITTQDQRLEQKVTRVFEIGDLALAPPNPVNPAALNQNLAVFGQTLQNIGQGIGQSQQFGQLGNLGGGLGVGGGAGGLGGPGGGLGAPGGALGAGGGAPGGQGVAGAIGNQGNLGVGGGAFGVGGGQLGQFGNLGGQFGIQGNNQSSILIQVIAQLVARGEWDVNFAGTGQQPRDADEETPTYLVKPSQLNSLGYYPVTNALIVRATSRYHPVASFKFPRAGADGMMMAPGNGKQFAAGDPNVMPQIGQAEFKDPAADAKKLASATKNDPKKLWNATFDQAVTDPQLIVSAAEFLFEYKEFAHAAESLKANLRRGHATGAWAYEALTIALQNNKADPAEVERVAMSAIDLDPADPKAYLRAAKASNDLGKHDAAIQLCQRAAEIEPNLPVAYANALAYAERSTDVKADVVSWASTNLLRNDWPNDGIDHAGEAKSRTLRIAKKWADANRKDDADLILETSSVEKTRDLMVEVLWQGPADLDLSVSEPSGSECNAIQKRTSGGGVLRSDVLEQDENKSESYTAASAFGGKYTVKVKNALGRAIGNKATVKVTKYAGTDKQEVELYAVDMANPTPISFTLERGSRTELGTVLPTQQSSVKLEAAQARAAAPEGVTAGFGPSANVKQSDVTFNGNNQTVAPLLTTTTEIRLPSISPALPGMRVVEKVRSGSATSEITANPVFPGKAIDLPMPKVQLLPGAK
jgi:tetratricopeptide (TPR) repeat protein